MKVAHTYQLNQFYAGPLRAVSYTHLDVYKRQERDRERETESGETDSADPHS